MLSPKLDKPVWEVARRPTLRVTGLPRQVRLTRLLRPLCALDDAHDEEKHNSTDGCDDDRAYEPTAGRCSQAAE